MGKPVKEIITYYVAALLFSWCLWISAMLLSQSAGIGIYYNEGFYRVIKEGFSGSLQAVIYVIFGLAVYGPLIAAIFTRFIYKTDLKTEELPSGREVRGKRQLKWYLFIFAYPAALFSISVLISVISTGFSKPLSNTVFPYWFIPVMLLYQLVTSGIEEFGWRGFLQPLLQKYCNAEKACYIVGIMWSIWHYPFIIYTNYPGGLWVVVLSLAGFTLLTVPQAFVIGWLYNSTGSIFKCIIFHAWANTASFYITSASPNPSVVSIAAAAATWLAADYLTKKYGKDKLSVNAA